MIDWPVEFIDIPIHQVEMSDVADANAFRKYGFLIWRNFMSDKEVSCLINELDTSSERPFHPVAHDMGKQQQIDIVSQEMRQKLINGLSPVLGADMGLTGSRFLVKKEGESGVVNIHQDLGYHIGNFEQISIFTSLNDMSSQNGGITVVPGSHHLGYLGDAGSLSEFYPCNAELCPTLSAGDALIMHCALIHHSRENYDEKPRKVFEVLLCPEEQPWRIDTISQDKSSRSFFNDLDPSDHQLFKSGRAQRLSEIRKILDQK